MLVTDEMVETALGILFPLNAAFNEGAHERLKAKIRSALEAALSHAAGQDGEQCRAASGASAEIESVIERLAAEAAACITVLGRAPEASDVRVMLDAAKLLRALSRGVPEDTKRLDWVLENAAMVETDGGGQWRVRFDWTAPIMYFSYRDTPRHAIDAAIADQRKEG